MVLAVISFWLALMALPTVFQMLWGKPKVEFGFNDEEMDVKALACSLSQPFVSRWLGLIGVRRPDARIAVIWSIASAEAGKITAFMPLAEVMDSDFQKTKHPTLSSSLLPMLHFLIAQYADSKVIAFDKERTVLTPGSYRADIHVLLGDREHAHAHRRFVVTAEGMRWLGE